ncbi:DUF202 domain-containing protein [Streptomyces sp. NPDC058424]|uniref:DUF202 domain-containing protein n=1 Tax=Streptomyces sp. NPDC058424 TaxID=3346491 RepID=UPI003656DE7B
MSGSERSPRPTVAEDLEDLDPGLAQERTWLAWRRTAISLTAVSAAVLKISPIDGALLPVMTLAVWVTGRGHVATGSRSSDTNARRPAVRLTASTIVLTALAALIVALRSY